MTTVERYFQLARKTALRGDTLDASRTYRLGAVGIRSDGTLVKASNIPNRMPEPRAHAEARLTRKLDWGSVVYVVRIHSDGTLALARPCKRCQSTMRLRGVKRCYYSIDAFEYGVLTF